jgi:hypothetical protein
MDKFVAYHFFYDQNILYMPNRLQTLLDMGINEEDSFSKLTSMFIRNNVVTKFNKVSHFRELKRQYILLCVLHLVTSKHT